MDKFNSFPPSYHSVNVRDVNSVYEKGLKVGCKPIEPSMRKYAVEKVAKVADPFGIM